MITREITREDMVRLARAAAGGIHRPVDCECPASYDPPEWVLEAMQLAFRVGLLASPDREVVDWLGNRADRLEDVRGRIDGEGGDTRQAVRHFLAIGAAR